MNGTLRSATFDSGFSAHRFLPAHPGRCDQWLPHLPSEVSTVGWPTARVTVTLGAPLPGYYEHSCSEHECAGFRRNMFSSLLAVLAERVLSSAEALHSCPVWLCPDVPSSAA